MRELSPEEIKFVKETHFTPTVYQCNEYEKTPFSSYEDARKMAKEKYSVDLDDFINKNLNQDDHGGISLEYVATYLLYTFFSKEELIYTEPEVFLQWLEDYRYFEGFRHWGLVFVEEEVEEAIEIYDGKRKFYLTKNNQIWNKEVGD